MKGAMIEMPHAISPFGFLFLLFFLGVRDNDDRLFELGQQFANGRLKDQDVMFCQAICSGPVNTFTTRL